MLPVPGDWCNELYVRRHPLRVHSVIPPFVAGLVFLALACSRKAPAQNETKPVVASASTPAPVASAEAPNPASGSASASPSAAPVEQTPKEITADPAPGTYPWLGAPTAPKTDGSLASRIAPPPGYSRVPVEGGSFSAFVRGLPLAPKGTPVLAHDGDVVRPADDDYVEAVVAIDVGNADLQQSSDVIVRLHAEWLWGRGERSKISYVASTKLELPLSRWEKGQRLVTNNGSDVFWAIQGKPKEVDYAEFRRYLDAVFNWGNSTSLSVRSRKLDKPEELIPGDFFLHSHSPGHVAIVLDVAEKPGGERVALLGQVLNPAQSLHVLRPGRATPWFSLRPGSAILTRYTSEFDWSELRRLDVPSAEAPGGS
jgi:hypothetical protein